MSKTPASPELKAAVQTAYRFLCALFGESDIILFRLIESWTENDHSRSRVDYDNCGHRRADPQTLRTPIRLLLQSSEREKTNLYFGVCPRFGRNFEFDLAWQIRTVRAIWIDIDHVTVEEALERVKKAGLPPPSIVVNSGHGVHLYWLLTEPYLINDVGNPPPVKKEWTKVKGRNKPRFYVEEDGERVYLDERRHVFRLSARAQHMQDVVSGVAQLVGGDHTHDVSRVMRLPGSWNRKDQKTGREPIQTQLITCEPSLTYELSVFEAFAKPSPDTERLRKIAEMPLPKPKKTTPKTGDKLADKIAASGIAPKGKRSEPDYAVCCFGIQNGIDKEEVWLQVEGVGKFAERGRPYFDMTWDNAEFGVRAAKYEKINRELSKDLPQPPPTDCESFADGQPVESGPGHAHGRRTIFVYRGMSEVGDTLREMTGILLVAKNCFVRADQLIVIHGDHITSILGPAELAGLLSEHAEFYISSEEGGEFKPLPTAYASTWLNNHVERIRLPNIKLFTRNPVYTEDWRLVASGFDPASGIYYAGPVIAAQEGMTHWDNLLRDFCFRAPADRTNYLGMLLTAILIPRFIGAHPALLLNGNQPGVGKSILAQILSIVRDGRPAETVSYNPNDEEFEKRLGAGVRSSATTLIIDNAKSRGRDPRIESACLERSITDQILSFRLLGQSATIRTENSLIFCITANTSDVSRDLVTRSAVVNMYHEGDPKRRNFSIDDPEGYAQTHRSQLLGELIGMVERWKQAGQPLATTNSRFNKRGWGNIVGGILHACGEPDFLANAEEAAASLDESRREFAELVSVMVDHPQGVWKPAEIVELCIREHLLLQQLGEGTARSKSTKFGLVAGRYVEERFELPSGSVATFLKDDERLGKVYRVGVETKSAER